MWRNYPLNRILHPLPQNTSCSLHDISSCQRRLRCLGYKSWVFSQGCKIYSAWMSHSLPGKDTEEVLFDNANSASALFGSGSSLLLFPSKSFLPQWPLLVLLLQTLNSWVSDQAFVHHFYYNKFRIGVDQVILLFGSRIRQHSSQCKSIK